MRRRRKREKKEGKERGGKRERREREREKERKIEREREKEREEERDRFIWFFFTCDGLAAKIREAQWCLATEKLLGRLQVGIMIEAKIIIDHAK